MEKCKDTQLAMYEKHRSIAIEWILARWSILQRGALTDGIPVSREQAACMVLAELNKEVN